MKSIVKTVIFCGQNNIPLRGKRDDNADDSNLHGNFQALLEFRIDSDDVKLKEHHENAPKNATYRSKTIHNEIIETVGNYICSKIIAEVKQTRMFSVMADEAACLDPKYISKYAPDCITEHPRFKNVPGDMPPDPPSKFRDTPLDFQSHGVINFGGN